jgi:hypothetical protein
MCPARPLSVFAWQSLKPRFLSISQQVTEGILFVGTLLLACYVLPLLLITVLYTLITLRVWRRTVAGVSVGSRVSRNIRRAKVSVERCRFFPTSRDVRICLLTTRLAVSIGVTWLTPTVHRLRNLYFEKK